MHFCKCLFLYWNTFSPFLQGYLRDIPSHKRKMFLSICILGLKMHVFQYLYFQMLFGVPLPSPGMGPVPCCHCSATYLTEFHSAAMCPWLSQ
uniref:Putative rcg30900-like protein n=1 Tax=Ixodes ricinus TaxID=34613 RepID=A0A0K8RLB8_IXORI